MIELIERADGVLLPVRAQPKARRNAVTGEHAGSLRVAVTQAPEKGKANAALVRVLADALDLRPNQVELHSGETSSHKQFRISGIGIDELRQRLARLLD